MRSREDDRLRHKLENKLSNQGLRAPCRLSVEVYQKTVTLTGTVLYDYQKRAAIQVSRSMDGVSSVIDRIKVEAPVRRWEEEGPPPHHAPDGTDEPVQDAAAPPDEQV
jgi:osmotically-inducible protein OsmY